MTHDWTRPTVTKRAVRPAEPTRVRWWFEDADGNLVLAQPPNRPALATAGLLAASQLPLPATAQGAARLLGLAAAGLWATEELLGGTTPARRVLGGVTLASTARQVAAAVRSR